MDWIQQGASTMWIYVKHAKSSSSFNVLSGRGLYNLFDDRESTWEAPLSNRDGIGMDGEW